MSFTLLVKRSATPGKAPLTTNLSLGEISMNTNDGILYFMKNTGGANSIVAIGPVPATANALTNSVTIALSGDATGSVAFNGANNVTIATTLANTGVTAGTFNTLTVNSKGLVTSASNISYITNVVASGDASGTSISNALTLTLASVNSNVGTFGNNTNVSVVTVNAKGLVTAVSNTAIAFPVTSVFGRTGTVVLASSDVTTALGYTPVNNAVVGVANGIATLDGGGKLTSAQIPSSIVGGMNYQGTWNASTNSPLLANGVGTKGYFYKVSVAGNTTIDGISNWNLGDSICYDGTVWDRIDGISNEVIGVAGRTGNVVLTISDISGGAPLASPNFTGNATSNTPVSSDNSTSIATTAFVKNQNYTVGPVVATGDVSGTSSGNAITLTLGTVNSNIGTFSSVVVNSKGLVTAAYNEVFSGDVSGTSVGSNTVLTLATVNSNIGTFNTLTINAKGLVTAASNTPYLTNLVVSGDVSGNSISNALTLTLATVTTAGTFAAVVVNAKGLVTGASTLLSYSLSSANDSIDCGSF